jgi:hypothetical protein
MLSRFSSLIEGRDKDDSQKRSTNSNRPLAVGSSFMFTAIDGVEDHLFDLEEKLSVLHASQRPRRSR